MIKSGVLKLFIKLYKFACLIRHFYPNDEWKGAFNIKKRKIEKAESLLNEAKARNEALSLSDFLDFDAKGQIIVESRILSEAIDITFVNRLYVIRNNVAHGDDILGNDSWENLFNIIKRMERVSENCESILWSHNKM